MNLEEYRLLLECVQAEIYKQMRSSFPARGRLNRLQNMETKLLAELSAYNLEEIKL